MINSYFDIERDRDTIEAGGFFCQGCLAGKPLDDQSHDPRYCFSCCEFLLEEAKLLPATKRPGWLPKTPKPKIAVEKPIPVANPIAGIMSTVKQEKTSMDIIPLAVPKVTHSKRGPKFGELPEDIIRQWASGGMGARAIATKLRKERRLVVSYKTIQRRLQGVLL